MRNKDNYLYTFKYDYHHSELCKLETRQLFKIPEKDNLLFSSTRIDPSISPFIRIRIEILLFSENYEELIKHIEEEQIQFEGFKVEYIILEGDDTDFEERRNKLKDIGYRITGEPNFKHPTITYGISYHQGVWYFGVLTKHNSSWHKHRNKPCSFSNSISMNIAKTLVSIASKGNKTYKLLDACCGVGTVMLESCLSGINIEGCDINWKAAKHARENLKHFQYTAQVHRSDIKDIHHQYDAIIVDLPYNLYSYSNDEIIQNIVESTVKLASRIVIVSISNIENIIKNSGLKVIDQCVVEKRGKSKFTRNIWVCENINKLIDSPRNPA